MSDTLANVRPAPMTPLMYRVSSRVDELVDTVTLTLEPVDRSIATVHAGQFTMLWVFGVGEAPISIARTSGDGSLVHTIRAIGAVTTALCAMQPGDEVGVRGPFGTSWPVEAALGDDVLVVAGGLGLSPVRPIVDHVLASRSEFRACSLFVGARSPDALYYTDELDALAGDDRLNVELIVDRADEQWPGQVGLITKLIANATLDAERTHAYLCGPEPMMRYSALGLIDHGVSADKIWVSLERNMHCAIANCGHCQLGALFVCHDGPVVAWSVAADLLRIAER